MRRSRPAFGMETAEEAGTSRGPESGEPGLRSSSKPSARHGAWLERGAQMKPRVRSLINVAAAVLGVLLSQSAASAGDLRVVYNVQDKPLKQVLAGSSLTFNLYSDSACTSLYFSQAILIDQVDVISKLKRFVPKGAVKPPKTDEIHTVLTGVPTVENAYLRVSATGVVPAGDECQFQASSQGIVAIADLHGPIAFIEGDAAGYVFAGPTVVLETTTATQRITGSAVAPLAKTVGSVIEDDNAIVALCYQSVEAGSPIQRFLADEALIEVKTGARHSYAAAGSVAPGPGTWNVGACVWNQGDNLNNNGNVNGWVMVTN